MLAVLVAVAFGLAAVLGVVGLAVLDDRRAVARRRARGGRGVRAWRGWAIW